MTLQELFGQTLVTDNDLDWIPVEDGIQRKIMAYNDAMMLVKVAFPLQHANVKAVFQLLVFDHAVSQHETHMIEFRV